MNPADCEFATVRRVIEDAILARVFPAASIEVGTAEHVRWTCAFGGLTYELHAPRTSVETVFDLASLTKVVATATVAMRLSERGLIQLDAPVRAWLAQWQSVDRQKTTIRDLLEHCSGLPAWAPLFETCASPMDFVAALDRCALAYAPRRASVYSDLGFILLGHVLETAGGDTLDRQLAGIFNDVFGDRLDTQTRPSESPGGKRAHEDTRSFRHSGERRNPDLDPGFRRGDEPLFRPPREWFDRIAPTRTDSLRGRVLVGEVDDDNAWALGGVAGHAGLFGTAAALGQFARAVMHSLEVPRHGRRQLAGQATMRAFVTPSSVPGSSRALGWDTMRPTSSCGERMSPEAFGHTGFTGTSLWIDPTRGFYVVLLTNRVHPQADSADPIQAVRRAVHDAVADGLR